MARVSNVVVNTKKSDQTQVHDWPKAAVAVVPVGVPQGEAKLQVHDWPKVRVSVNLEDWPAGADVPKSVMVEFDLDLSES